MSTSKAWFKPLRKSYIATNYKGALSYIPFVAYLTLSLVIPINDVKPKTEAIFVVVPNWIVAAVVMTVFARSKST